MQLTHELAGMFIALVGIVCIALATVASRQLRHMHVHAIEQVEPAMMTWLVRGIGFTLFILGAVTLANIA